jgi:uncharacterized protein (AIM24 family)
MYNHGKAFICTPHIIKMQHEIVGDLFQWLRIEIQSESIQGDHEKLLCRSEGIKTTDNNFFGTGWLIFSGNGKIKEFYLHAQDTIVISEQCILAADITTKQESISTTYINLVRVSGPGTLFVCGEDFSEFYLDEHKTVEVRTSCIVALDSTVTFNVDTTFSSLSGPGAVLLKIFIPGEKREFLFDRL